MRIWPRAGSARSLKAGTVVAGVVRLAGGWMMRVGGQGGRAADYTWGAEQCCRREEACRR